MNIDIKEVLLVVEKYKLLILLCMFLLSNLVTFFLTKSYALATEYSDSSDITVVEGSDDIPSTITVDVSGAVVHPGVYSLPSYARINDALALSGGVTNQSSQEWVLRNLNLSLPVKDSQKIYIPFESDREEICKSVPISKLIGSDNSIQPVVTPTVVPPTPTVSTVNDLLVKVNSASIEDLDTLPGIGATYAQKIVESRPYKNIEELQTKTKIPQSTITKLANLISFE